MKKTSNMHPYTPKILKKEGFRLNPSLIVHEQYDAL